MDIAGFVIVVVGCLLVIAARRRIAIQVLEREEKLRPGLVGRDRNKYRRAYELAFAGSAAAILVIVVGVAIR
jgi:hypothetical protein